MNVWNQFWFPPVTARHFAICRILFYAALAIRFSREDFSVWATVHPVFLELNWLFSSLSLPILSEESLKWLSRFWILSLSFCCIGLFTRFFSMLSFVLGIYLLGLSQNTSVIHHSIPLIVLILFVMSTVPSGNALSVDAFRKPSFPRESEAFGWAVRLIQVLMAIIYFCAGVSKLKYSGLDWWRNISPWLVIPHSQGADVVGWGRHLADVPWVCWLMGNLTLAFELVFPICFFSRTARIILLVVAGIFHLSAEFLLGISFRVFLLGYVFWIPWGRVEHFYRQARSALWFLRLSRGNL